MCTLLSNADAVVLRKWTRTYRYRWYAWAGFAVLAVTSGSSGLWQLVETISAGRRIGLTALQTLLGSPLVEPLDAYRLLAMASSSYIMLEMALFCIPIMLFIRKEARRYQVVLKLLPADDRNGTGPILRG